MTVDTMTARSGRVLRMVVWALLPLLVAEGAARALEPRLPPAPMDWGTPELPYKLSILPPEGADILVVGTSVTDAGVDPMVLDAVADPDRPTFNGSLGAGTLPMVAWTTRELWLPRLQPDLVIVGVVSRDVNANDPRQATRRDAFFGSKEVRARLGDASMTLVVDRWLASWSSLWAHRSHLRSWEALTGQDPGTWGPELTNDSGQYLPFVSGTYDPSETQFDFIRRGGLNDWEIDPRRLGAVREIVEAAQAHGASVLLLDAPTAKDWTMLHPDEAQDVREYTRALTRLAAELDVPLVRPASFADELFADVVHLNGQGADELSRLLGRCVVDLDDCPTR